MRINLSLMRNSSNTPRRWTPDPLRENRQEIKKSTISTQITKFNFKTTEVKQKIVLPALKAKSKSEDKIKIIKKTFKGLTVCSPQLPLISIQPLHRDPIFKKIINSHKKSLESSKKTRISMPSLKGSQIVHFEFNPLLKARSEKEI